MSGSETDAMDVIRSGRQFARRFLPKYYREKYIVARPPSQCPQCGLSLNWIRARWGAWLCKECGHFTHDEDRLP